MVAILSGLCLARHGLSQPRLSRRSKRFWCLFFLLHELLDPPALRAVRLFPLALQPCPEALLECLLCLRCLFVRNKRNSQTKKGRRRRRRRRRSAACLLSSAHWGCLRLGGGVERPAAKTIASSLTRPSIQGSPLGFLSRLPTARLNACVGSHLGLSLVEVSCGVSFSLAVRSFQRVRRLLMRVSVSLVLTQLRAVRDKAERERHSVDCRGWRSLRGMVGMVCPLRALILASKSKSGRRSAWKKSELMRRSARKAQLEGTATTYFLFLRCHSRSHVWLKFLIPNQGT